MKKKFERVAEINARLREVANLARTEEREISQEEKDEIAVISREKSWLEIELRSADYYKSQEQSTASATPLVNFMRENVKGNGKVDFQLREGEAGAATSLNFVQADAVTAGMVPLTIGDIVKPLSEGIIWRNLGIQMPTGLNGNYEWPIVGGNLKAEYAGEEVELTKQKIDLSKVPAVQQRLGITASLSNQAAFNSEQKLRQTIMELIPHGFEEAINEMVLSPTQLANCALTGPFVKAAKKTLDTTKGVFAAYNKIKADLLNKGYSSAGLVWVMSEGKKAELEATSKDAGSGIMVVENDRLCGLPIFTSHTMGEKVGLGDFRYQVVGQFGIPSFIVDPVLDARKDLVNFTCNMYFATATLRQDAFVLIG